MSITHNKNLNPLLNLLIICISSRFLPRILFIKGEFTFRFSSFKIGGFYRFFKKKLPSPGDHRPKYFMAQ